MRRECKIKVHEANDTAVIEILGDMTESAGKDMDAAQQEACGHNPSSIVLKFHEDSRINSTGIAIIINLVIDSRERGCKVFVSGLSRHYRKIFQISGLIRYTTIVDSEDEIT